VGRHCCLSCTPRIEDYKAWLSRNKAQESCTPYPSSGTANGGRHSACEGQQFQFPPRDYAASNKIATTFIGNWSGRIQVMVRFDAIGPAQAFEFYSLRRAGALGHLGQIAPSRNSVNPGMVGVRLSSCISSYCTRRSAPNLTRNFYAGTARPASPPPL